MTNNTNEDKTTKLKEIMKTVDYLASTLVKSMIQNDKLVDNQLFILRDKLNTLITRNCKESLNYLNMKGLIATSTNNADEDEDFELYNYHFKNIRSQEDKNQVQKFMTCVSALSNEENDYISTMNETQEKINNSFDYCKKACVYEGVDKNEEEIKIISNYQNCISKVEMEHKLFTKDYLTHLNQILTSKKYKI